MSDRCSSHYSFTANGEESSQHKNSKDEFLVSIRYNFNPHLIEEMQSHIYSLIKAVLRDVHA